MTEKGRPDLNYSQEELFKRGVVIKNNVVIVLGREQQERLIDGEKQRCYEVINATATPAGHCPMAWDRLMCWDSAPPNSTQSAPCPRYYHGSNVQEVATRECLWHGRWASGSSNSSRASGWTNYTLCLSPIPTETPPLISDHIVSMKILYTTGYSLSLFFLLLAVIVLLAFKRLRCPRNTIHVNLFLAFILRSVVSFLKTILFVRDVGLPQDVLTDVEGHVVFREEGTHWECRLLVSLFNYSILSSYSWIFVEGLYLHVLLFATSFQDSTSVIRFILLGWLSPLGAIVPWVVVRAFLENTLCWGTHETGYLWLIRAPVILLLTVSFVFFVNIVRILVTKLRAPTNSGLNRHRRLAKSTLVLVPLFGAHFILLVLIPHTVTGDLYIARLYIDLIFNSFQGFLVAVFVCFLNGEVQAEIKKLCESLIPRRKDMFSGTDWVTYSHFNYRRSHGNHMQLKMKKNKHTGRQVFTRTTGRNSPDMRNGMREESEPIIIPERRPTGPTLTSHLTQV